MRTLLKSFKTEINPTEEQKVKIRKTIGTCRYIYNFYLAHNKELHDNGEKFMSGKSFSMGFSLLRTSEFFVIRKMEMSETKTHLLCGWSQIVIQKITFPLQ